MCFEDVVGLACVAGSSFFWRGGMGEEPADISTIFHISRSAKNLADLLTEELSKWIGHLNMGSGTPTFGSHTLQYLL